MPSTSLVTVSNSWSKVRVANSTASAFVIPADVTSKPTSAGYLDLLEGVSNVTNTLMFKFFGTDANNETGSVRIYGVRKQEGLSVWTHDLLFQGDFTLCATTGVAGGLVSSTEFYADTLSRVQGIENVADQLLSPTGDVPAWLMVDFKGYPLAYVELIVGTAASVNALYTGV